MLRSALAAHSHVSASLLSADPHAGTYKIPTANDIPLDLRVTLLRDAPCTRTPQAHSSKAVGEPPFFLGASVFFALKVPFLSPLCQQHLTCAYRTLGALSAPLCQQHLVCAYRTQGALSAPLCQQHLVCAYRTQGALSAPICQQHLVCAYRTLGAPSVSLC